MRLIARKGGKFVCALLLVGTLRLHRMCELTTP